MGLSVQDSVSRVQGSGFRVQGLELKAWDVMFRVQGSGFRM